MKKLMFALMCLLMLAAVSAKEVVVNSASGDLDVTVEFNSKLTKMTGSVSQDGTPVPGANLEYFCQDYSIIPQLSGPVESYVTATNLTGEFEYLVVEKKCEYGDNVWVVVTYDGTDYVSKSFSLTHEGNGNSGSYGEMSVEAANVPEFSSLTLGITMVGAGLIFAFIRKR